MMSRHFRLSSELSEAIAERPIYIQAPSLACAVRQADTLWAPVVTS